MVHRSWGAPAGAGTEQRDPARALQTRPVGTPSDDTRLADTQGSSGDPVLARLEARAAERAAAAQAREALRQERRRADAELTAADPHRAAEQRRRGSGRKDIVREQRDTSGYTMIVERQRVRALAARGASAASLAAAFNLPIEEIEGMLACAEE
ncbi:hypothetical protein [Sphingomonas sp.]|uniref:hypothetical protein n=1 Tax=Sphingomonas sp. TaxID=28214 RepID=UPI00261E9211|nr:hypothetical protein [Sphingomonas sp.]MDF2493884.1 hypothetical protein [Sphingomonas sp.]